MIDYGSPEYLAIMTANKMALKEEEQRRKEANRFDKNNCDLFVGTKN